MIVSVDSENAQIDRLDPRLTLSSADASTSAQFTTANQRGVAYVDDEVSPGRIFSIDNYYSDDHGASWTALPTAPPGSSEVILAHNGYLFAAESGPLTVYRASYSSSLSSLSWSQVIQGQSGSSVLTQGNDYANVAKDPDSGVMLAAEYGFSGGSANPRIYRSTDDGGSWSQVYEDADGDVQHFHAAAADPYNGGHWHVSLGDNGSQKLLRSTDGGKTWSRVEYDLVTDGESSPPVGIAFTPNYILFADDSIGHPHGPWRYDRETGMICSVDPAQEYRSYIRDPVGLHIFYDENNGVIYFGLRDHAQNNVHLALYARFIGDKPQLLARTQAYSPRIDRQNNYLYNRYFRFPIFGGVN